MRKLLYGMNMTLDRAGRRVAVVLALAAGCAGPPAEERAPPDALEAQPVLVFRFESGFWINLHHVLYESARRSVRGEAWPAGDLGTAWDAAVAHYRTEVINQVTVRSSHAGAPLDRRAC